MDKLKFIGRGSAFSYNEINNSAYFIHEDTLILIDCGCDVFKKILNKRILFTSGVKRLLILITHMHDDHVGSLMSLLEYCKYSNNAGHIEEIMIHDSILDLMQVVPAAPLKSRIDTYMNIFGMSLEGLSKVRVVTSDEILSSLGLDIRNVVQTHSRLSYGYTILDVKHKHMIYYSGDTNTHDPLLLILDKPQRVLGIHIDCYLECSTLANTYYKGTVHFPEFQLSDLLEKINKLSRDNRFTYTVNLMHIDEYDTYSELSKKLIVTTI